MAHRIIKRNRNYERPSRNLIQWEVYIDGKLVKTFDSKRAAIDFVMKAETRW